MGGHGEGQGEVEGPGDMSGQYCGTANIQPRLLMTSRWNM